MAKYDRGVYEPSDEVRVFDGSEEEEDVEGSRLPLLIVLALLVLAMFGGVVWLAYTQGVARGRGETPVLTAAAGPERVAPPQGSGANTVPYQGFKIYEQPAPPDDSADSSSAPAAPAKSAAAPVAEAPKPAPPPAAVPQPAPAAEAAKPTPPPPAPKLALAPKPAPMAAKPAAAPPKSVAALIQQANATPVAEAPRPTPAARQAPAPVGGPATGAPRQLGAISAASPVQTAAAAPAKPAASGGYVLQIGAYKSQADADAAWKAYKAKHAALLAGYSDEVQQADLGEKGTWYRLRINGFADKAMATSLCDRLKADGGACIPGK
ncbi:MAG TPA: SPOR domain-containing protein [Rhizomicrobium sp.]|nr:SPOR domain-containing protein [Rhizomicrobium sp.]